MAEFRTETRVARSPGASQHVMIEFRETANGG